MDACQSSCASCKKTLTLHGLARPLVGFCMSDHTRLPGLTSFHTQLAALPPAYGLVNTLVCAHNNFLVHIFLVETPLTLLLQPITSPGTNERPRNNFRVVLSEAHHAVRIYVITSQFAPRSHQSFQSLQLQSLGNQGIASSGPSNVTDAR